LAPVEHKTQPALNTSTVVDRPPPSMYVDEL
jgi:hypothetical protein